MSWKSTCTLALQKAGLFQDSHHLSRFKELVDCYRYYPFFTKGLCKCMYLSAWDEEHFCIMLETLAELTLGRERNTSEMKSKGACLAEASDCREYGVYQLSLSFLEGTPFCPDPVSDPKSQYIIDRGLEASRVIDSLE